MERQADFQRDTLIELQEVMPRFAREAGRVVLDEHWNPDLYEVSTRLDILLVRVGDDELRRMVQEWKDRLTGVQSLRGEENRPRRLAELVQCFTLFEHANKRLGDILRSLY